ncbi:MAG: ABC transporter permease [Acidimicrobiales bacterium]|jgi:ABC transporter DrrB family efflux protein
MTTAHQRDRLPTSAWITDPLVIARRNMVRTKRTPQAAVAAVTSPVLFLLLMRLVFGGAIHIPFMSYADYLVPAMLVQNIIFGGLQAATGLGVDVNSGLIDRFRSLPTPASAPLLGRSISDLGLQMFAAALALLAGVAIGFRLNADVVSYLVGIGLLVLISLSLFWVFAALGITTKNPETVQATTPIFFLFLFVSNAFIPVDTLPRWLQSFARNQPISIFDNALRALSQGTNAAQAALGHPTSYFVVASVAWCIGLTVVFAPLTLRSYRRL